MGHWYDGLGKLHEVDLRTGRKFKFAPSVNEIIHELIHSEGLDIYKSKQMFQSALTLPRPEEVSDDEFYELVVKDSKDHADKAADFGTTVHYIATQMLRGNQWQEQSSSTYLKAKQIVAWTRSNFKSDLFLDYSFSTGLFGGTIDYMGETEDDLVIVDWKTQETKNGKFKQPYDNWLFQLCGYKKGIEYWTSEKVGGIINLIVSSTEDIEPKVYIWKPEKIKWGISCFDKMVELYKILKRL